MIPKFRSWVENIRHPEFSFMQYAPEFNGEINKIFENDGEIQHGVKVSYMQSTGLKDKNGVEIYEGDIVQSTWYDVDNNPYNKKGEITFVGAQYVIVYDSQFDVETGEITYDAHSLTYAEDVEVIGNIYENPELLS